MDWLVPFVFALIATGLVASSIVSRRIEVGPSGDWVLAWTALVFSGIGLALPVESRVGHTFAAFVGPVFPVMLLSGAFRYAGRPVPHSLGRLALVLGSVSGASTLAGVPVYASWLELTALPILCITAAAILSPAARAHGTILQRLLAPGLLVAATVLALDGLAGIAGWGSWNTVRVWLVVGLPVGTLQFAGVFELVGDRLAKTSEERDRTAAALAQTIGELRVAHSLMEERVAERTAQLRDEVAERCRIEEQLRNSEAHYRKVTSLMTDFNYAARARPDGSREVVWITGRIADAAQAEPVDERSAERPNWRHFVHPEDVSKMQRCVDRALAGEVAEFEIRLRSDPQDVHWIRGRMMAEPLGPDGEMMLYATGRDATADKRAEEEYANMRDRIREGQRLESLGALARGVAHDFNNLLNVILGNAAIIAEDLPRESPLRKRAERIRRSARYAADISTQMLTYSGSASVSPEPIDLSRLVFEMSELLEAGSGKRLQLDLELEPELPQIEGDPAQLRQVILNLITNASEAMGEAGGHVRLQTGLVHVGQQPIAGLRQAAELDEGDYVCLEVADDGPGLDEETQARVFDPFFSTKLSGRGLGLAVVHGIVRAHHAAIALTSEPGSGTRFRVLFPVQDVTAHRPPTFRNAPEIVSTPAPDHAATVLVIDDDESVSELAQAVLQRAGYDVLVATGGGEGVETFEKNADRIALVVLDVSMPDVSGDIVLERIRSKGYEVPAIVSSGYAEALAGERMSSNQRVEFLSKPYEPEALVECVRSLLREA